MKIDTSTIESCFDELFEKMGVPPDNLITIDFNKKWDSLDPSQLKALSLIGIEIPPEEVQTSEDGFLDYRGHKIVLYIRDHNTYGRGKRKLPKFHIRQCSTLEQMVQLGKKKRYVVTTNLDKKYKLNIDGKPSIKELDVCRNCLKEIPELGYDNLTAMGKNSLVKNIDIPHIFKTYGNSNAFVPIHNANTAPQNFDYENDWREISRKIKSMSRWRCSSCNIDLKDHKKFLQAHHIDGEKNNNDPNNLKALCVKCHSECPMHSHMKGTSLLEDFLEMFHST